MDIASLLEDFTESQSLIGRGEQLLSRLCERGARVKEQITAQVDHDFGVFVGPFNAGLPEDKRITRWHTHYDAGIRRAFITITGVGGNPYYSEEFTHRLPLPDYLEGVKRFDENYPVEARFDILNYSFLDMTLDEMK